MASLTQNFKAGATKGQTQEKTNQVLGNVQQAAQGAFDGTQQVAQAGWDKTSETAQAGWNMAVAGKDNTGAFLQQTGENVVGMAQGATNAVKETCGMTPNDKAK